MIQGDAEPTDQRCSGVPLCACAEPSTGDVVPLDSAAYHGVEAVFNGKNYWVNMQEAPSVAVCRAM